jgi:putative transposase
MKHRHRKNFNDAGHAHELTFSCYKGFALLESDRTCQWLAEAINSARREYKFDL